MVSQQLTQSGSQDRTVRSSNSQRCVAGHAPEAPESETFQSCQVQRRHCGRTVDGAMASIGIGWNGNGNSLNGRQCQRPSYGPNSLKILEGGQYGIIVSGLSDLMVFDML